MASKKEVSIPNSVLPPPLKKVAAMPLDARSVASSIDSLGLVTANICQTNVCPQQTFVKQTFVKQTFVKQTSVKEKFVKERHRHLR